MLELKANNPGPHESRIQVQGAGSYCREVGRGAPVEADPEAVIAYYRVHFKPAFARSEDYEKLILRMQARFIEQGREGILKSRGVEDRLVNETWASPNGYDLHPKLKSLNIPALVITGDHDIFPFAAEHIAQAIPGVRLVTLKDCGHFPYLECPVLCETKSTPSFVVGSRAPLPPTCGVISG